MRVRLQHEDAAIPARVREHAEMKARNGGRPLSPRSAREGEFLPRIESDCLVPLFQRRRQSEPEEYER